MSQPNATPSQTILQPNEAPSPQLLTQRFSMGTASYNQSISSSEPLRNELEKRLITTSHQHKKLLLQAEHNKELEMINRKYESLYHEEDSAYHRMVVAQYNDTHNKVSMHPLATENFLEKLAKSNASRERSTSSLTTGQLIPPTSQQVATITSPVASFSATRLPVLTSFHSSGSLRSEATRVQPMLATNSYRAMISPPSSILQQNGSYGATARAQLHGPSYLEHLGMPQPYATVHKYYQHVPVIGPRFTSLRHPGCAHGILTSPLAGVPMTSISSNSLGQISNLNPGLTAGRLQPGSVAGLMSNLAPRFCTNPVAMAPQQVSTLNLDAAAGIYRHRGGHIDMAGIPQDVVIEHASLPFQQRWHAGMGGAVLPSIVSSSGRPSTLNTQAGVATSFARNPFFVASQQGPRPDASFQNNADLVNGIWLT